jgi:hypothetical protein
MKIEEIIKKYLNENKEPNLDRKIKYLEQLVSKMKKEYSKKDISSTHQTSLDISNKSKQIADEIED